MEAIQDLDKQVRNWDEKFSQSMTLGKKITRKFWECTDP
jgi:hypothetical protein